MFDSFEKQGALKTVSLGVRGVKGYWRYLFYVIIRSMPNITIDYLGGFFDGEGCVYSTSQRGTGRIRVAVSQTLDHRPLIELKRRFGGGLYPGVRGSMRWQAGSELHVRRALEALLPVVLIKKHQVIVALKFLETRDERYLRVLKVLKQPSGHQRYEQLVGEIERNSHS